MQVSFKWLIPKIIVFRMVISRESHMIIKNIYNFFLLIM